MKNYLLKGGLTFANLTTLAKVVNRFGDKVCYLSLRDMAKELKMNHVTLWLHLKAGEKAGFLTITKASARKLIFHINGKKVRGIYDAITNY